VGVDHVVVAAPVLADAVAWLGERGIACEPGGRHPAHGTMNALAGLGPTTYLEVLGPDPDVDPRSRSARGQAITALEQLVFHEVVLALPDDSALAVLHDAGQVDAPVPGRRERPDGAACTPDFFLFDAEKKLAYRGQLDEARPSNDKPNDGRHLRAARVDGGSGAVLDRPARLVRTALTRTPRVHAATVAVNRDEGSPGRSAMMPVTLSSTGIATLVPPALSSRDRVRFETTMRT